MLFRSFLMFALVLSVSACASKKETAAVDIQDGQSMTAGAYDGMGGAYPVGGYDAGTAVPGSQQDLVVNVGDRVFFGYDQYTLTPEAQNTLQLQAEWLKKYPSVSITISGHSDERGTREYNLALGERRANAAKSFLVALGIDGSRVSTVSYGKERPSVLGANETSWAQNRRAATEVN